MMCMRSFPLPMSPTLGITPQMIARLFSSSLHKTRDTGMKQPDHAGCADEASPPAQINEPQAEGLNQPASTPKVT